MRRRKCFYCGEMKEVYPDSKMCDNCEQKHEHCTVCNEWFHYESDPCRHLRGCGSGRETNEFKQSFMLLLKHLSKLKDYDDKPLVPAIRRQIRKNNFWTTWHGPLIGRSPDLELRYEKKFPKHKSVLAITNISSETQESWGESDIKEMQDGMKWLTSLDESSTHGNRTTVRWISEFLKSSN